jgi:hypothetical protein
MAPMARADRWVAFTKGRCEVSERTRVRLARISGKTAGWVGMTTNESIPELRYGNRVFSPTMREGMAIETRDNGLVRVRFDRDKTERDWNPTDLGFSHLPRPCRLAGARSTPLSLGMSR